MSDDLHLFRFGYTWPEELEWIATHPEADRGEASDAVYIRAPSREVAEELGQEVAEVFVRTLYGVRAYSWRELRFASWIEDDPDVLQWATNARVPVLEPAGEIETVVGAMMRRLNETGDTPT